jgi:uncharacterized protein YgiM (DUF1202 family)
MSCGGAVPTPPSRFARDGSALGSIALIVAQLSLPLPAAGQPSPAGQTPAQQVRVPTSHANVHMGPNTTTEVLVLVPKGTILAVLGRDGEWLQVRLTPELRKTGMVMRWYKNEDRGWMHDSTVEIVKPPPPKPH